MFLISGLTVVGYWLFLMGRVLRQAQDDKVDWLVPQSPKGGSWKEVERGSCSFLDLNP